MIIRRLIVVGDRPLAIDLHPRLTTVASPDAATRQRVADSLAGLLDGRCDGVEGTVLIDDAEFDIEPDLLDMLGLVAGSAAAVVGPDDLAQAAGGTLTPARAEELDRLQARLEELSRARAVLLEEAEAAAAAASDRDGGGDDGDDGVASDVHTGVGGDDERPLLDERQRLEERRAELAEERAALIDRLSAAPAPGANAGDDGHEGPADGAEVGTEADHSDERAHQREAALDALHQRLDDLGRRREILTQRLATAPAAGDDDGEAADRASRRAAAAERLADAVDAVPVESALEAYQFVRGWRSESLPEALDLADRLERLAANAAPAGRAQVPEWLRTQTVEQLEEARAAVAAAELADTGPKIDPAKAAALEEAHSAVDEAADRAGRRFAGGMARRRLEAARAAENELLAELGLGSYADYLMMRASGTGPDPEAERRLAVAKEALADAEAVWQEIEGQSEALWPGREAEEEALRTQARALLGSRVSEADDNIEQLVQRLRAYRTPVPDWRPAAAALVAALRKSGEPLEWPARPTDEDAERLEQVCEEWLGRAQDHLSAIRAAAHEHRTLVAADARIERQRRERVAGQQEIGGADGAELEKLAAEEAALEEEVARLTDELTAGGGGEPSSGGADGEAMREELVNVTGELETVTLERTRGEHADLEADLADIDRALAEVEEQLERLRDDDPAGPDQSELVEAAAAVASIEAGVAGVEATAAEVEADDDDSQQVAAAAELAALDAEAATVAGDVERLMATQAAAPARAGAYLSERAAAIQSVGDAGLLPLIVHDALEGQPPAVVDRVLAQLVDLSATLQVIVLTGSQEIEAWAGTVAEAGFVSL